jgi:hypothetical protein
MFLLTALLIPRIISGSWGYSQAFWGVIQCLYYGANAQGHNAILCEVCCNLCLGSAATICSEFLGAILDAHRENMLESSRE